MALDLIHAMFIPEIDSDGAVTPLELIGSCLIGDLNTGHAIAVSDHNFGRFAGSCTYSKWYEDRGP